MSNLLDHLSPVVSACPMEELALQVGPPHEYINGIRNNRSCKLMKQKGNRKETKGNKAIFTLYQ